MDKLWLQKGLNLYMTPYECIGTDCMQGYVEFVPASVTIAMMQYGTWEENPKADTHFPNIWNTFKDSSVMDFFVGFTENEVKE
jgi:hypothetical protein